MEHLASLTQLELLQLDNTDVTLDGLRRLRTCKHLKKISAAGMKTKNVVEAEMQLARCFRGSSP